MVCQGSWIVFLVWCCCFWCCFDVISYVLLRSFWGIMLSSLFMFLVFLWVFLFCGFFVCLFFGGVTSGESLASISFKGILLGNVLLWYGRTPVAYRRYCGVCIVWGQQAPARVLTVAMVQSDTQIGHDWFLCIISGGRRWLCWLICVHSLNISCIEVNQ